MQLKQITMADIRSQHLKLQPDSAWFSKGAMQFFQTKLPAYGYDTPAGIFFVTSESFDGTTHEFTVRKLLMNGHISSPDGFYTKSTRSEALAWIKQQVKQFIALEGIPS